MPDSIKDQIKRHDIGNLYLLYGPEAFLVSLNENRLVKAVLQEGDEILNLDRISGPCEVQTIKDSVETLPMMAERRVVLIEEAGAFEVGSAYAGLEKVLADIPETSLVIFTEKTVDKRSKTYKQMQKSGRIFEMNPLDDRALEKWVGHMIAGAGKSVAREDVRHILELTGADMNRIQTETGKLISYVGQRPRVAREDIDLVVTPSVQASVFRITDLLGSGRGGESYCIYRDLVESRKEKPQDIFNLIASQFRRLYRTILMESLTDAEVGKEIHAGTYYVPKYRHQAASFGRQYLERMLKELMRLDREVKHGDIDIEDAITLVLVGKII